MRLVRTASGPLGTFGTLHNDQYPLCQTVERPWLDNHPQTSCIPAGEYEYEPYDSPTKGPVFLLKDVPGRSMIEVHIANFSRQLEGCIAPGWGYLRVDGEIGVANSGPAFHYLQSVLPKTGKIVIINAF